MRMNNFFFQFDARAKMIGQNTSKNALLGVSVDSGHFSQGAGGVSIRPVETFSVHDLLNLISSIAQSNRSFVLDESFVVRCTYIDTLTGSGRSRTKLTMDNVGKRSFVTIKNNDNICSFETLKRRKKRDEIFFIILFVMLEGSFKNY